MLKNHLPKRQESGTDRNELIKLRRIKPKQKSVSLKNLSTPKLPSHPNLGTEASVSIADDWDTGHGGLNLIDYQQALSSARKHLTTMKASEGESKSPRNIKVSEHSPLRPLRLVHLDRRKGSRERWARPEIEEIKEMDEGLLDHIPKNSWQ